MHIKRKLGIQAVQKQQRILFFNVVNINIIEIISGGGYYFMAPFIGQQYPASTFFAATLLPRLLAFV